MSRAISFSIAALIARNLGCYWRSNLAVILGAAVSVAALTGSLLVGDSVRGTLHDLALERLGTVKYSITTPGFFRDGLASDLPGSTHLQGTNMSVVPAIIAKGTMQNLASGVILSDVDVLGVTDEFFALGPNDLSELPQGRKIAVNSQVARDLDLSVGDSVLVTLGRKGTAPAGSIFARRSRGATLTSMRLTVEKVVPSKGIGVFALAAETGKPRNIFVSLSTLQQRLGLSGKANTVLVASSRDLPLDVDTLEEALAKSVHLEDYGLRLVPNSLRGYSSLENDGLVIPIPAVEHALQSADKAGMKAEASSIYMANTIALRTADESRKEIPYSVVASIPQLDKAPFGPLPATAGDCSGEFPWWRGGLLNAWAAEDLGASVGDKIEITYFTADESNVLETRKTEFVLRGIVAMQGPGVDRGVVPSVDGITSAQTMQDWDPPFPIDLDRIRSRDEAYWNEFATTPKVYLSPLHLQYLWKPWDVPPYGPPDELSPLDWTTSVRIAPRSGADLTASGQMFIKTFLDGADPKRFGLKVEDVAQGAQNSAKGSSDFGVLFLSMSLFIVCAAAGLVGLLFRLTVEQRTNQHGIMMATGFSVKRVGQVLTGEGMLLALAGVALGVPSGIGYAALIILGLRTVWSNAAGDFAFALHVTPLSLSVGCASGFIVALIAVRWALRLLKHSPVLTTLFGWRALAALPGVRTRRRSVRLGILSASGAGALLLVGFLRLIPVPAAFFLSGALIMAALLSFFCAWLHRLTEGRPNKSVALWELGLRSASRNWARSILSSGLMACACFVLITVAANQQDLTLMDVYRKDTGSGGFSLIAHSTTAIHANLNSREGLKDLAFPPESSELVNGTRFYGFPVSDGDDISCLNIQRPERPRILGVPEEVIERDAFVFAKTLESANSEKGAHRWELLTQGFDSRGEQVIPAIADAASAEWILHVGLGETIEVVNRHGDRVHLQIVGLLSHSVFQGEVLISEVNFRRHFDGNAGDSYYLIETPPGHEQQVAKALRQGLGEHGFDVQRTVDVLASYAAVQNTYLSTFQTLGGLGLLLGTLGIVIVLLRNVVERRAELAMLLALGFRRGRVIKIILIENGLLLVIGGLIGSSAALVAVAPHWTSSVANVNWLSLATTLFICMVVGLVSCYVTAVFAVRKDLLLALRAE